MGTAYFSDVELVVDGVEEDLMGKTVTVYEGDSLAIQPTIYKAGPRQCFVVMLDTNVEEWQYMNIDRLKPPTICSRLILTLVRS